jgi:hypothetical protein
MSASRSYETKRVFYTIFCNLLFLGRFWTEMFAFLDLGIFVAVGNVLVLEVKI